MNALTMLELIAVIAMILLLIGLLLPTLSGFRERSSRTACSNCLKHIGLAARIFATDHEEKFPWQVSTNTEGSREYRDLPNSAFRHFAAMSNELSTPKVLHCPEDKERAIAIDWQIGNQNISYFVGLYASETNANSFLSGDRNLQTNGVPVGGDLLELTTNLTVGWTTRLHKNAGKDGFGYVVFGDGHVDALSNGRLQEALIDSGVATNRLLIP